MASPTDEGTVELVVRRPVEGEREVLEEGVLDAEHGLVGDRWRNGSAHPDAQLTLMNARAIALIAGDRERWALAGDQLYVDLDLSKDEPPTRHAPRGRVGGARGDRGPHTGCAKFTERFGSAATRFVNKPPGRDLRLRGMNAKVVEPGTVRAGRRRSASFVGARLASPSPSAGTAGGA